MTIFRLRQPIARVKMTIFTCQNDHFYVSTWPFLRVKMVVFTCQNGHFYVSTCPPRLYQTRSLYQPFCLCVWNRYACPCQPLRLSQPFCLSVSTFRPCQFRARRNVVVYKARQRSNKTSRYTTPALVQFTHSRSQKKRSSSALATQEDTNAHNALDENKQNTQTDR